MIEDHPEAGRRQDVDMFKGDTANESLAWDRGWRACTAQIATQAEAQILALTQRAAALQEALEARKVVPLSAEHEYICSAPTVLPEEQATEVLALIDKLEQDDDVHAVFHTLA